MSRHKRDPDGTEGARIVFDADQPVVVIEGEGATEQVIDALVDAWLTAIERIVTGHGSGAADEDGRVVAHMDPGELIASHRVAVGARGALRRADPTSRVLPSDTDRPTPDFAFVRYALARRQVVS
jgi:hypothetical protein